MLRYNHRFSKDIDIFVSDPQALGFVNPKRIDVAESLTQDYVEAANFVTLYFPEGEIDFAPIEFAHYMARASVSCEECMELLNSHGRGVGGNGRLPEPRSRC